mgnify:FL=1
MVIFNKVIYHKMFPMKVAWIKILFLRIRIMVINNLMFPINILCILSHFTLITILISLPIKLRCQIILILPTLIMLLANQTSAISLLVEVPIIQVLDKWEYLAICNLILHIILQFRNIITILANMFLSTIQI